MLRNELGQYKITNYKYIDNRPGIYMIFNKINSHKYIGSTVKLRGRMLHHFYNLNRNTHHSEYLQNSFNKYGIDNFKFIVLEIILDINSLLSKEQYYLDYICPEYNICPTAGNVLGRKHSQITKDKIGKAHLGKKISEESIEKMSISAKLNMTPERHQQLIEQLKICWASKRAPMSDLTKEKLSKAMKGKSATWRIGKKLSDITKRKISESHKGKIIPQEARDNMSNSQKKKITQYDLDGNVIAIFRGAKEAAGILKCNPETIRVHIRANKIFKGFIFKYD